METTTIVEKIKKTLGDSWNGVAVNGTSFTQWNATPEFFELWKEKKEDIKENKFSLYKHDVMGWVVTFFGSSNGIFESYEIFKKFQEECQPHTEECPCCGGSGWDEQHGDKCDECGATGEIDIYPNVAEVRAKYTKGVEA